MEVTVSSMDKVGGQYWSGVVEQDRAVRQPVALVHFTELAS